jgi:hypothetical protein
MHESSITGSVIISLAMGAFGLYLLLPPGEGRRHPGWARFVGGSAAALSMILVATVCGGRADGWTESRFDGFLSSFAFWLLAGTALVAATSMITRPTASSAAIPLLVFLLSGGGLLILAGAAIPGIVTLTAVVAAVILVGRRAPKPHPTMEPDASSVERSYEPALICIAGCAIAIALVGSVRYATAVEAVRPRVSHLQTALPPEPVIQHELESHASKLAVRPGDRAVNKLWRALRTTLRPAVAIALVVAFVVLYGAAPSRVTGQSPSAPQDPSPESPARST